MPMLTTFLIFLPVCPFHAPERTRLEDSAIWSKTACTFGTTFPPSTSITASFGERNATCSQLICFLAFCPS